MVTVLSLFMVSCGQVPTNILRKIDVQTSEQEGSPILSFTAQLNLGAMSLAYLDLPIFHPKTKLSIGSIRISSGISGEKLQKIKWRVLQRTPTRSMKKT